MKTQTLFVPAFALVLLQACNSSTEPFGAADACVEVKGTFDPAAPGFIVSYNEGVDPVSTTSELETKYKFSATHVYTAALQGFSAELSASALSGVSCEPTVALIEHNAAARLAIR